MERMDKCTRYVTINQHYISFAHNFAALVIPRH
jgi:hypothetical protein